MYLLKLALKRGTFKSYSLDRLPCVVGSGRDAEVRLPHSSIAAGHARLFEEQGALWIEDLGSASGIQINGAAEKRARLRPGDRLRLGALDLEVAISGPPARREKNSAPPAGTPDARGPEPKGRIPSRPRAQRNAADAAAPRGTAGQTKAPNAVAWKSRVLQFHRRDPDKGRSVLRDDLSQLGGLPRLILFAGLLALAVGLFFLARFAATLLF